MEDTAHASLVEQEDTDEEPVDDESADPAYEPPNDGDDSVDSSDGDTHQEAETQGEADVNDI